jgi:hypothetical protein
MDIRAPLIGAQLQKSVYSGHSQLFI